MSPYKTTVVKQKTVVPAIKTTLSENISSALKQIRKDKEKTLLQRLEDYAELRYDPIGQYQKMKRTNTAVTSAALTQEKLDQIRADNDKSNAFTSTCILTAIFFVNL